MGGMQQPYYSPYPPQPMYPPPPSTQPPPQQPFNGGEAQAQQPGGAVWPPQRPRYTSYNGQNGAP